MSEFNEDAANRQVLDWISKGFKVEVKKCVSFFVFFSLPLMWIHGTNSTTATNVLFLPDMLMLVIFATFSL